MIAVIFAAAVLATIVLLCARADRGVSIANPVTYVSLFYFLPQFVLKPFLYHMDWLPGVFTSGLGGDTASSYSLALSVGIGSLVCIVIGFYLPFGRRIAISLPSLDRWYLPPESVSMASLLIYLLIGIPVIALQIRLGRFSYGYGVTNDTLVTISAYLQFVRASCLFLAWYSYWKSEDRTTGRLVVALLITAVEFGLALLSGARSPLLVIGMTLMVCFTLAARKRVTLARLALAFGPLLLIAAAAGMLVGTTFRSMKGAEIGYETETSLSQAADFAARATMSHRGRSFGEQAGFIAENFVQRLDSCENLALILAYAGELEESEEQMGMRDNIVKELMWSLVPRFLYPEKPIVGDIANKYARLYLRGSDIHSAAMTAMGDLYRNFGFVGIVLGMTLFGVYMRAVFAWLRPLNHPPATVAVIYAVWLLYCLGLESGYASLFVGLPRLGVVMALVLVAAKAVGRRNYGRLTPVGVVVGSSGTHRADPSEQVPIVRQHPYMDV